MEDRYKILKGDCFEELKKMESNSVDSIVMDPPYGLGFMNKEWDSPDKHKDLIEREKRRSEERAKEGKSPTKAPFSSSVQPGLAIKGAKEGVWFQKWFYDISVELLRVLKAGGYLLSFGGPRTYHRMATAVEDAGFEIRDQVMWVFGSGFPKSRNVSKDITKKISEEEGRKWEGFGTGLKPAHEPIVMARKPLEQKSVADNVLEWGTGAINIDNSRVGSKEGRWPADFIHDGSEEVVKNFPNTKTSKRSSKNNKKTEYTNTYTPPEAQYSDNNTYGDEGSAARFFYCPKAQKKDRNEGLEEFEEKEWVQFQTANGGSGKPSSISEGRNTKHRNTHPTVKPTELMKYLVRMVTPPNGVVLDPFMGSGSTGKAALLEGFSFIGIEKEQEYIDIAEARIKFVA